MTRIDELSPDRRAVLSLILRRGRSYAEIGTALQIDEDTVREHAHGALVELAGEAADGLNESEREQIGDYLLSQQSATERLVTYDELEGSAAARAFAGALAPELAPMAANPLPEIPGAAGAPAGPAAGARRPSSARRRRVSPAQQPKARSRQRSPAPPAVPEPAELTAEEDAEPRPATAARAGGARPALRRPERSVTMPAMPSSRVGGAILLGLIVLGVVLAIVLSGGGGGSSSAKSGAAHGATGTTGASAGSGGQVQLSKQIRLTPPAGGSALGAAAVLSQGGRYVLALAAEHLPPTQGFFYAAWLYNSPTQAYALGKAPSVSSDGKLKPVAQALPESAGQYHQLIITRETNEHPSQPGETVLTGAFSLH